MNTELVKAYNGFSIDDLRAQLVQETDPNNINDITRQLNAHLQKKDILRKVELSDLQDKLTANIEKRVSEKSDCFSNKDLIDYFKTIDDAMNKIDSTQEIQAPQVKIDQKVNINIDPTLTREERNQALDAFKAIINKVQLEQLQKRDILDGDYKEIENDD